MPARNDATIISLIDTARDQLKTLKKRIEALSYHLDDSVINEELLSVINNLERARGWIPDNFTRSS